MYEYVNPPSPRSTDDPYPAPSPPPRSPAFSSPAFSRTLALSLNLMSPTGFTISGGRKAFPTDQRYTPEPNVLDFHTVQRTISNDSSQGDLGASSPCGSSGAASPTSPLAWELKTGTAQNTDEAASAAKDGSRVKQFLFHRDRDRTRKAQLLYHAVYGGADSAHDSELATPQQPGTQRGYDSNDGSHRSGHRHSRSHSRSGSRNRGGGDQYLRIDLETDIRAGTSGLVYSPASNASATPASHRRDNNNSGSSRDSRGRARRATPQSHNTPLGFVPTPAVPIRSPSAAGSSGAEEGVATSPFGSNSPYYRALTLGNHALSPAARDNCSANTLTPTAAIDTGLPPKARRSSSVTSTSSSSSRGSLSSTPSSYSESDSEKDPATAYESQFPALPQVPRTQSTNSLPLGSFLHKRNPSGGIAVEVGAVQSPLAKTSTTELAPVYTMEEICAMFHAALCGSDATEQRSDVRNNDAARAFRAWDDADSDSDEDSDDGSRDGSSTASDGSSVDSRTAARVATLQDQVRRIGDIDATCANLMAKCDYIYDILKRPPQQRFDAQWLSGMVQPSVRPTATVTAGAPAGSTVTRGCAVAKAVEQSLQSLFASGLVHAGLVYQLVQALQYEDHRFESARLPLLYALYTATGAESDRGHDYCLRRRVAAALEHACLERQQRCAGLASLATRLEMDVNYISKVGYSELCLATDADCPASEAVDGVVLRSLTTGCDLTAIIEGDNERPVYRTRDSEGGLIELLKFIVAQEVHAALDRLRAQEREAHPWSEETKASTVAHGGHAGGSPRMETGSGCPSKAGIVDAFLSRSHAILESVTASYNHLFRCYTQKLGVASENVEQPVLLEQLLQCLDGLLAWSKVLGNLRGASTSDARTPVNALDTVCERILRCTEKHWVAQVNYAQDIAYMLQSEMILTIYAPAAMSESSAEPPSYSAVYKNLNKSGGNVLPPLPSLRRGSTRAVTAVSVVLRRLLQRVTSAHTKVASQAIHSLQNPVIMVRYFLPRMSTAMVSYIFGTEVGRITFLSGVGKFLFGLRGRSSLCPPFACVSQVGF